jgi:hypothetical protein
MPGISLEARVFTLAFKKGERLLGPADFLSMTRSRSRRSLAKALGRLETTVDTQHALGGAAQSSQFTV